MSKCQRIDRFMRKVQALLYYVHTNTYNRINCNRPLNLVRFHTRSSFFASLYVRAYDSDHPVTYARQFCTNTPGQKIYPCISVSSTRHHTLLNNPRILHRKTFSAPACHLRKIYHCMKAHSTRHHKLLHNPRILHTKKFFAPACHPR